MTGEADGIGARLRAGRERLGLTVLQAAEKLHVDARILESLEAENFDALGAQVFARGHLRHYAELVGESVSQLNELYSHFASSAQPDLTRIPKAPPPSDSNKLVLPALVVLGVFAVAGAVWWVLSLSPEKAQTHLIGPPASTPVADSAPAGETSATPAGETSAAPAGETSAAPTAAVEGRRGGPASKPVPPKVTTTRAAEPRRGAAGGAAPGSAATQPGNAVMGTRLASATAPGAVTDASSARAAPPAGAAPHPGRQQQLTLRFSADSWTEVYDATGARLYYDVGAADTVHTLNGPAPLRIVLGNAAGVTIEVNGHGTPIARLAQPDGSAQFLINRSGRAVRARSAANGE